MHIFGVAMYVAENGGWTEGVDQSKRSPSSSCRTGGQLFSNISDVAVIRQ